MFVAIGIPGVVSVSVGRNWVPEGADRNHCPSSSRVSCCHKTTRDSNLHNGAGASDRSKGFTHALVVRMESKEILATYQEHEKHVDVKEKHIIPNLAGVPTDCMIAMDWESEQTKGKLSTKSRL